MLLRREQCPECATRGSDKHGDNLAVYSDHVYCYSCGYSRRNADVQAILTAAQPKSYNIKAMLGTLSPEMPPAAAKWIERYGLTFNELRTNGVMWSERAGAVVFPFSDDVHEGTLYSLRNFRTGPGVAKSKTLREAGAPPYGLVVGNGNVNVVVIVEDAVSAIKVARVAGRSIALLGSTLTAAGLVALPKNVPVRIWLDRDKATHALLMQSRLKCYMRDVRAVVTPSDPKDYSAPEITRHLALTATKGTV